MTNADISLILTCDITFVKDQFYLGLLKAAEHHLLYLNASDIELTLFRTRFEIDLKWMNSKRKIKVKRHLDNSNLHF